MADLMWSDSVNPYGLKNGRIVTIRDVPPGLACGCYCPSCGSALVAKKGKKKVHHFSHLHGETCKGSFETALHYKAKEIFSNYHSLTLPMTDLEKKGIGGFFDKKRNYYVFNKIPKQYFSYYHVFVEQKIGKIRADIILQGKDGPFIVEIFVNHRVEKSKVDYIKTELKVPALEIDLSLFKGLDLTNDFELWDSIIDNRHNKKWLSLPAKPQGDRPGA